MQRKICRLTLCAALGVSLVATSATASTMTASDLKCQAAKEFTIGADGGSFTYGHIKIEAPKGTLTKATKFMVATCPGSFGNKALQKTYPMFEANEDGSPAKMSEMAKLNPSSTFASMSIKAPEGLNVEEGSWLNYCLLGDEKNPAHANIIFHEDKVAPLAKDHTPSEKEYCVRFRSLSFWHHVTHAAGSVAHHVKHAAHKATHAVKHAAHKAEHGMEDAAKDVAHESKEVGKDVAKGAKKGFEFMKGLVNPCSVCKTALNAGINYMTCKMTGKAAVKAVEDCTLKVDEVEPEIAEYSAEICGALEATAKQACKLAMRHNKGIKEIKHMIVDESCHTSHLCG